MKATGSLIALQSVLALAPCKVIVIVAFMWFALRLKLIGERGSLYCPMTPGTSVARSLTGNTISPVSWADLK